MENQIILVLLFTFVIHLISTLSYSVRIVGVRTGKIAVSFALFNILVVVSRTANSFQAPLLAKHVELNLAKNIAENFSTPFRLIILAATLATIAGGLLIPTFQRICSKAVTAFNAYRSVPRLLFHAFSKGGLRQFKESLSMPSAGNITQFAKSEPLPVGLLISNMFAVAILTVGVLASLYAGYLNPQLRVTCNSLSAIINGTATILMFIFIDPYLSVLTDDVVCGKCSHVFFRRIVVALVFSRLIGTLLGQLLLVPAAKAIAFTATLL